MRPTVFQRLFIDDRPFFFLNVVGAIIAMCWVGAILLPALKYSVWEIGRFLALMAVAACLGIVLSGFLGGPILGLLVLPIVARLNGAPFRVGDEVVILSKRFRGRVTCVYEVWAERRELRLELGKTERKNVTDVFSYTDVCRPPRK